MIVQSGSQPVQPREITIPDVDLVAYDAILEEELVI